MKHYIFLISEIIIGTVIFILSALNIFPPTYTQYVLIAACVITGLDIISDTLSAIINLDLLNIRIYMTAAATALIVTAHPHEALLCLITVQITGLLSDAIKTFSKRYPLKFVSRLFIKEALLQTENGCENVTLNTLNIGDTIIVSNGEIVPLDCTLLEDSASFEADSIYTVLKSSVLYAGDEVPGGIRVTSPNDIRLKVAVNHDDSTLALYANAYLSAVTSLPQINPIRSSGYFCNAITTCFKNGIIINNIKNIKYFFKTKIAIFTKESMLDTQKYKLTSICPKDNTLSKNELLKYAARAELPYADSYIGHAILDAYNNFSFLSDIIDTVKYPNMGIKTVTNTDTILAGNKLLMISHNVKGLPDFAKLENGVGINATYIYIAVNNRYLGYLHLIAPSRENISDIIRLLHKKKVNTVLITEDNCSIDSVYNLTDKKYHFNEILTNQTSDKKHANLIMLKQKLKLRTNHKIIYFDTSLSDATLTSLCDYNIIMGPILPNRDISFADAGILSGNYAHFATGFNLLKKACHAAHVHTFIILLFKFLVFLSAVCFPEVYFWHAVAADCLMYLLISTQSVLQKN